MKQHNPRKAASVWRACTTALALVLLNTLYEGAVAIRLSEVRIPNHILRGSSAKLECLYELDNEETLYSVKWYKDGNEFFRYHPKDNPPARVLELPGVSVDLDNSTDTLVTLKAVPLLASGRYRCEVLGEAPAFHTVAEHGDMTVVALPSDGPRISGGRGRYQEGDTVKVSCASGPSSPPATLAWFVNGEPADPSTIRGPRRKSTPGGLHVTSLGLEFKVKPEHFKDGDLKLKCSATIATVYWRSNEESVEGERPQRAPALESRDSAALPASDQRADRVRATTLTTSSSSSSSSLVSTYSTLVSYTIFLSILNVLLVTR